jgi:hypothetical protein
MAEAAFSMRRRAFVQCGLGSGTIRRTSIEGLLGDERTSNTPSPSFVIYEYTT